MLQNIPDVSVVIPTHNCANYIVQAIESVLSQRGCDNCDIEIIVIDDGSQDNTGELLKVYGDGYPIRYIYQENRGVCLARNRGIDLARGEFVAFLDADDWFLPNKLASQLAVFRKQPDLGIVHSGWYRVDEQGEIINPVYPWENMPKLDLEGWLVGKAVLPSAMMFRREWLLRAGGFDPQYTVAEDVDLVWRLALAGCRAEWLREITVCYRQRAKSAMGNALNQAKYLSLLMDNFFSRKDLPETIPLIERDIRYGTLVWVAWYLYQTGQLEEMAKYLRQAWRYSVDSPMATLIYWVNGFAYCCKDWGARLDTEALVQSPQWQDLVKFLSKTESLHQKNWM
jgi:glycosyltransferase involved in cell wall biosynthesis